MNLQQPPVYFGATHPGRAVQQKLGSKKALKEIKTLKDDSLGVEKSADEIKTRYAKIFGV